MGKPGDGKVFEGQNDRQGRSLLLGVRVQHEPALPRRCGYHVEIENICIPLHMQRSISKLNEQFTLVYFTFSPIQLVNLDKPAMHAVTINPTSED